LHPQNNGTGRYQRAVSFLGYITYRSEDRFSFRSGQEERENSGSSFGGKGKRSFQEVEQRKDSEMKGTSTFVPTCYQCHEKGHLRPNCPTGKVNRAKPEAKPDYKGKADKKKQGMFACVSYLSAPLDKCNDASIDTDDLSFDHFYQIDSAEQAFSTLVVPLKNKDTSKLSSFFSSITKSKYSKKMVRRVNLASDISDPKCVSLPMLVNDQKCLAVIGTGPTITCVSTRLVKTLEAMIIYADKN